ncbi:hypothetical protein FQR65_LT06364 [Abscondita terminalis]|nr:hypothetical protein FQR65_LT06364 [Abscondita terminalis]
MNDKVAPTFKKAIQISPTNLLAWNGLANYYEKNRDDEETQQNWYLFMRQYSTWKRNDDKKLIETCEKLKSLSVSEANFSNTVNGLWKIIQNEETPSSTLKSACASLAAIISKAKSYPDYIEDMFEKALSIILNDESLTTRQYYTEYLKMLYKKGNFVDLFKMGEKMFELYSTDLSSIKWMCKVFSELYVEGDKSFYDKKDRIEKYCEILLRIENGSSAGLLTKAVLLYDDDKILNATEVLNEVAFPKSGLAHAWILLARCYFKLYLFNEAAESALQARNILVGNNNSKLGNLLYEILPDVLSRCSEDEYLEEGVKICLGELNKNSNNSSVLVHLVSIKHVYITQCPIIPQTKNLNEALTVLESNVSETSEWWCELGSLYWDLEEFEKCLVPFLKAAKLDPSSYLYFLWLGNYYSKFNDLDKARRCYEKVCSIHPKCIEAVAALSKIYRAQKSWDANVTILQNLTNGVLNSENRWAWLQLGLNFLEQEDYVKATDTLRFVVRANPNDSYCWESLADAYVARGAYTSALKCYQKAIEIIPNSVYPLLQIANIKKALGEFAEACKDYESILYSNKTYIPALKGLAETFICQVRQYAKSQRLGLARDVAENALHKTILAIQERNDLACLWKLAGESCIAVAELPDRYCCMLVPQSFVKGGDGDGNTVLEREELFVLAERCYYKAVTLMQNNGMLWYDLASCYFCHAQSDTGNPKAEDYYSKAASIVEHCVTLDPDHWQHWNLMGVIHFSRDRKDYALAQHAFIKAVTVDNNSAMAWCNLGTLYLVLGYAKLANEAYSQAQRADPNYVNSWIGQALIAESLGIEDAMDLFRHSTLLGVHPQGAIGYGNWVCRTLLEMPRHTTVYSIHNMYAIPVACDAMTWYTEKNPDDSCGWNMLGLLRERMGLKSDALVAFKNALRSCSNRNRDQVIINCGRILFKLQKYQQAINMFQDVEEATFNSGSGLALSLFKGVALANRRTNSPIDLLVALASIVYMFQGPDPAKTLLFQSTELTPPSPYGFYATLALGLLHSDRNLAKLVLKELCQLQDVSQCRPHYAKLICHTYVLENETEKAIREISKLVHRHPDDASLWLCLATLLIRSYKTHPQCITAASYCAKLAVTLGRTSKEVIKMLCVVSLASFIGGEFSRGLISAQKAVHCYPDAAECWAVFIASAKAIDRKCLELKNSYLLELSKHVKENLNYSTSLGTWMDGIIY